MIGNINFHWVYHLHQVGFQIPQIHVVVPTRSREENVDNAGLPPGQFELHFDPGIGKFGQFLGIFRQGKNDSNFDFTARAIVTDDNIALSVLNIIGAEDNPSGPKPLGPGGLGWEGAPSLPHNHVGGLGVVWERWNLFITA